MLPAAMDIVSMVESKKIDFNKVLQDVETIVSEV